MVLAKILGWKQQFLSQAGKEVFIKTVALAVPTYPMNIFDLPDRLCSEIDVVLAKFWWGNRNKDRGIHWLRWDDLGRAKEDGGLSFRSLKDFNSALLVKQCWCLLHKPDSL